MRKFICTLIFAIAFTAVSAFADINLPDGYVQGLPNGISIMDTDGYSPDAANGELYIDIPNMIPGELYTKDIAITNLRDDAQYSIYMTAEPNYTKGNVDLLNETVCRLYLDDELIYEGLVTGKGTPDMQRDGLDLGGVYKSGASRKLHAEFVWNWMGKNTYETEDKNSYYAEVSFYWIFYAQTDRPDSTPGGGGGGGKTIHTDPDDPDNPNGGFDEPELPDPKTDEIDSDDPSGGDIPTPGNVPSTDNEGGIVPGSADLPGQSDDINEDKDEQDEKPGVLDKIADRLPIPEDVKTGYHSEIVFYIRLALCAFTAAFAILAVILYKLVKLNRLKKAGAKL